MRQALKRAMAKKSARTLVLVGCSGQELVAHLESLFQSDMGWHNYGIGTGKWHVDHKRPCASFDLTNPEQQKVCFHYSNLQPMWELDNLTKGAKWKRGHWLSVLRSVRYPFKISEKIF